MAPHRNIAAATLLIAATACYPRLDVVVPTIGGTADDSGTSDGGATGDLVVEGVFPTDGPKNGGTLVEISGGPFDDSAKVRFGDADASVTDVTSSMLTVTTPASTSTGLFDVTVSQDSASGSLPDAWYYWDNADGDAVILGTWLHLSVANEVDWDTSTAATFDTWMRFIQPTDAEPWERYGIAMDSCGNVRDTLSSLKGPDEVLLGYDSQMLSLTWNDSRQEYAYNAASSPDALEDEPLVLQVNRSELSPPMILPEAARTQQRIEVSEPDMRSGGAELEQDDASVTWTTGDYGHVMVVVGTGTEALFMCMAEDDGNLTMSPEWFDDLDWQTTGLNRTADVWMAFVGVNTGQTTLAWTNGVARIDAGVGVIGNVTMVSDLLRVSE